MLGGAGGVLLVIIGSVLVGRGGGLFLLGLLALLGGAGLVVAALLRATEASVSGGGRQHAGGGSVIGGLPSFEGVKRMSATSQWTAGAVMGVIALFGLFLYSRAGDGMFAAFGGILFLFGLAVIIVFVHKATDYTSHVEAPAAAPHAGAASGPAEGDRSAA
jgi:hypothetical protein